MRPFGGAIVREWMKSSAARCEDRAVFLGIAATIAALGLAVRVLWVSLADRIAPTNSEMLYVARTFAKTGQLADAYGPGSGLTAHVTPIMPIYAGMVYRAFGTSPGAEIALIAVSLACVVASIWAIDAVMCRFGMPALPRLVALAGFVLLPLNFSLEMQSFRVWEGALAAAGLSVLVLRAVQLDERSKRVTWTEITLLSAIAGLMALASPPVALTIYGCLGLLAWRRRNFPSMLLAGAISAVVLAGISYPWAVRNEAVFGEKVWSRTNFGFNVALGFHDAAVHPANPRKVFVDRLAAIDPFTSKAALADLKNVGGEQAYSKMWTARTKAWVAANPGDALLIATRHLVEFYFPPRWYWSVYGDSASSVRPRQAIVWAISLLAFLGLAVRLWRREWRSLYLLAALALPALPYLLAQPILRYRYVVAAILFYLAVDFTSWVCARLVGLRTDAYPPPTSLNADAKTATLFRV